MENILNAYIQLLNVTDWKWRSKNQAIYIALRDKISEESGLDIEKVQNNCEEISGLYRCMRSTMKK